MPDFITVHGLQVAHELHHFIEDRVLPATGVASTTFWAGFAAIVADLAPRNAALLAESDRLQREIDAWHTENPGPITDMPAYRGFLERIAYLLPQPADVKTTTADVDAELALAAGPQLVVPILNAPWRVAANPLPKMRHHAAQRPLKTPICEDPAGRQKRGGLRGER